MTAGEITSAGDPPHIGYNFIPGVTDLSHFCSYDPAKMGQCMKEGKECFHRGDDGKLSTCKEAHWPAGNGHHPTVAE